MAGFKTRSTRRSLRSVSRQTDHPLHQLILLYCRLAPASPQELLLLLGEPTLTSIAMVREEKLQKRAEVKKLRTGLKDTRRSSR